MNELKKIGRSKAHFIHSPEAPKEQNSLIGIILCSVEYF